MEKNLYKQLLEKPTEVVRRFLNYNSYLYYNQTYTFLSMFRSALFGDKYEKNCLIAMKALDKKKLEGVLN